MMRLEYWVGSDVLSHPADRLIAYGLALPIGWDRESATNGGRVSEPFHLGNDEPLRLGG